MIDDPKTLEEAEKLRYDQWAGNSKGVPYRKGHCVTTVSTSDGWHFVQCSRKNGYGMAGLYCKQHAKKVGNQ